MMMQLSARPAAGRPSVRLARAQRQVGAEFRLLCQSKGLEVAQIRHLRSNQRTCFKGGSTCQRTCRHLKATLR